MRQLKLQIADGLEVSVIPNLSYEFLMPTADVAKGYGVKEGTIREHKRANADELIEGEHFLTATAKGVRNTDTLQKNFQPHQIYWTKAGIIRLGFFIKSNNAKMFRNWAEKVILREMEKPRKKSPLLEYHPADNQELGSTFQILAYREIVKIESSRVRNRLASLIEFYTNQIN